MSMYSYSHLLTLPKHHPEITPPLLTPSSSDWPGDIQLKRLSEAICQLFLLA